MPMRRRMPIRRRLWELFDGDREHPQCRARMHNPPCRRFGPSAVRIAHADGSDEILSFDTVAAGRAQFAHWLDAEGVQPGERIAFMLEPSLPFYVCLFGAMQTGAISVPMFTLFGPDALKLARPRLQSDDPHHQFGKGPAGAVGA
jgi:acetyl-CoA synthetase